MMRFPRLVLQICCRCVLAAAAGIWLVLPGTQTLAQESYARVIDGVQPNIVKIYGAGGVQGLEHYQSGFLISAEGHVLTAWSYVLDSDEIIVMLHDGRRLTA